MFVRRIVNGLLASMLVLLTISACGILQPAAPTATALPPTPAGPSIIGLWKGIYDGAEVSINFETNGNFSIAVYGSLEGGTYTVNYDTTPYQLDLNVESLGVTITTVLEVVDENTIKIENVYPGVARPTAFSDFFLLTR